MAGSPGNYSLSHATAVTCGWHDSSLERAPRRGWEAPAFTPSVTLPSLTTPPSGSFLACHLPLHRGGYIEESLASHRLAR